uniref:BACON domain-containing protein n=1 Tax=Candidatus Cryptobacteroides bacterium TaxID=3085639 RepID=UPI004027FC95
MKIFKNILRLCAAAIIALPMAGCGQDELVKPSALLSESSLTFEAIGAESQTLTIASDESWFIDVDADWITVDPMSGTNTVDVTVTVTDNVKNGAMDAPREGTLTIANNRGYSIRTVIYQEGDNYLGVEEMPISKIFTLDDGLFAKVAEAQVVALTSDGFVATDESASIYVSYKGEIAIGDKVSLAGEKVTLYGNAALEAGGVTVKSNAEVTRPEPVDLLSNLDPSKANVVTYVTVEAGLLGHELKFEQSLPVAIKLLDPRAGVVDIESVNMHNISVKAYVLGLSDGELTLAVTDVQDNGINDSLNAYFYDDFSWMKSYIDASGVRVDDSVGDNNSGGEAPNLRSNDALSGLLKALTDKGYEDLNPNSKVIYAQKYYWKFGKTSTATVNNNNGMILPKQDFKGDELINVDLDFDWAAHMTGSGNIDKVQIVVELTGKGFFDNGTQISDPFVTTQEKGHLEWQHATVAAKGVNNTTRFIIRPAEYASVTPDQQRWHLDNIKIADSDIPYSDPVYAKVIVSDDVITFEGTPDKPYELKIESDNPWTLTKGSDADWLSLDVIEGPAGEETTVKITCEPSTSSKLRHAVITLASADTRKNIHVVQSAAGGELDPLISISTGNTVEVLGQGAEFTAKIQSNVEFETEINGSWITEVSTPATKAVVETVSKTFKAEPNLTGTDRTGTIRFFKDNIESVLTVKQAKFEPSITVTYPGVNTIAGIGETRKLNIVSNVPFTVTAPSWVKLPAMNIPAAGTYPVDVTFEANSGTARTGQVVFKNAEYNYTYTVDVAQAAAGVCFFDDFGWLTPLIDTYTAAGGKVGDTIGNKKDDSAINIYGDAVKAFTLPAFANAGYEDMNPSLELIYLQDKYLKFNKTGGKNTSIRLPKLPLTSATDVTVEFDHAAMVQGSGKVDDSGVVVVIEGDGQFENGTKYSDVLKVDQPTGTYSWTHSSAKIKGATANTRLVVVMYRVLVKDDSGNYTGSYNYKVSGAGRIFIDNINIHK